MHASLLGVGSGEADLLTARAAKAIEQADRIILDADVPASCIGTHSRQNVELDKVALRDGAERLARDALIQNAKSGRRVIRVRAGNGWQCSEALRDIRALEEAGVSFEVIAGVDLNSNHWRQWLQERPLHGRTVVITRMRGQADETAEILRMRGAEVWVEPTIEIAPPTDLEPLHKAVRQLGSYRVVAFTSSNGVRCFFQALGEAGLDARALGNCLVGSIGPATASALKEHGILADVVAEEFRGEALARAIEGMIAGQPPGSRILIPRAEDAREVLPEMLRGSGLLVDVVPAYSTHLAQADSLQSLAAALSEKAIDAVLLTSSSTVRGLIRGLGDRFRELLAGTTLASIGPITTNTASEQGLQVAVTASEYTLAGLISALEAYWSRLSLCHNGNPADPDDSVSRVAL